MDSNEQANQDLLTLGQIARRLGVPAHRLKYAIEEYRIDPVRRIGVLRVWSEDDISRMVSALRRIESRRR